ncbi:MAG TPA: TIGR02281 family clan AA aspartic protease [Aestuariivirgaceae bacterium]|nr:TIGR02281 family clan AA aspartic protease [Aestuariivirgaceae bacterium]
MTRLNTLFFLLIGAAFGVAGANLSPFANTPQPFISDEFALPKLARMIEIRAGDHGHYVTTASIEHMPVSVLVDTGASKVALSYEDAERIGLKPFSLRFDQPVSTANGVVEAATVTLRRIEIDNVIVHDVDGMVLPQGAMRGTLLGMSFLSRLSGFRMSDGTLYLEQ